MVENAAKKPFPVVTTDETVQNVGSNESTSPPNISEPDIGGE